MTRAELVDKLASHFAHIPIAIIDKCVKSIFDQMANALEHGKRIEIRRFGSFCLHYHPPRRARNPKTGETLMTEGRYHIYFKAGKDMRDRVNQRFDESLSEIA